ncbi:MAG: sulfate adenylyltransferase [Dehalococcoidales bacterium]|mgnify:CR=1 FL=1|jgi:sulfate adenylyltransferase|nr:sulfate adenylyltransferase [Dehalococcoidales bacterium]MAF85451.1 sulfate adenylyltransferase [Dehalococcoidales bacterium]
MPEPHGGKLINRVVGQGKDKAEEAKRLPQIVLSKELVKEVQNITYGVFSPLEGFLTREDYISVLDKGRLATGVPWTIPIVLDVPENSGVKEGYDAALVDEEMPIATIHVEDIYPYDREELAQKVFGTTDSGHPGVTKVYSMKEFLLGGKIDLIDDPRIPFAEYYLNPQATRRLFEEKGWRTVVAFQTRNIPHVGHEYLQKTALTFTDGLFINPVIGKKKSGDFKDELILKTYHALIDNYYPKDRVIMSILPMEMRYAGPREAIFHAIIRKNFGCTHFIVGRDHAGVGNYYPPYAAQDIFKEFPDLGITPMFFRSFYYCQRCLSVVNEKTCPHRNQEHIDFSGTKIREMLLRGERPPEEVMRREVAEVIMRWEDPFVG